MGIEYYVKQLWPVLAISGFFGLVLYVNYYLQRKRTQTLQQAAMTLGFSFEEEAPEMFHENFSLPIFERGHSHHVRNVMRGETAGTESLFFDFRYTVGHGKHSSTSNQTIAAFHLANGKLCGFELRPEFIFHQLTEPFGYHDIDFPENPVFSKKYFLCSESEAAVRNLFNMEVLQFFENASGWCVQANQEWLIVYRSAKLVKPENFQQFVSEMSNILRLFHQ
ncbi:MAG: hypothetical protein A3G33_09680 [Omnitrophica bacterium RIFCSPLOWO2_12_FULL_44_17]|uniref:DUF3137 domain-containing protein n=1 Tax=Candidatus Danuiimicrobium aquiferis TaxID=1801832 RepID=A0A1G1KXW3_9BACT|nr:MAG: hypothetical protein A3B72_09680 [Omnitrophica bacterium RIFCSPHIGHO2_02_FULL_45_28]OGW89821.1 MAG: hypothetical protein A3E74_02615 [Omnitrophica bacterium RIFCSPHIGHO2_12_FULL_44_12]OGW97449.1 MAG: hypothetical protein A3G33_09680 [Omnitrophica bacterium RIFCSPLOWO2_12_FULL_44_17]OGX04522.1 MAG: hypothetical protein A3J12_10720 [Omnitrophica bacterium RIFCSPLOWO2_02_FULL_44_11]